MERSEIRVWSRRHARNQRVPAVTWIPLRCIQATTCWSDGVLVNLTALNQRQEDGLCNWSSNTQMCYRMLCG